MSRPSRNAAPARFGLSDPLGRQLWICALMVVLFIAGTYALSTSIQSNVDENLYLVTKDRISFSAPPPWIGEGVLQEIADVLFLDQQKLDVRDRDLTQRIALAVEKSENPWIKSVERVVKHYPTKVLVDIQYRRPVAMVLINTPLEKTPLSFIPVDAEGVILSGDNKYLVANVKNYPRVDVGRATPNAGMIPGKEWGDVRVAEAARIADALGSVWGRLNLFEIVAAPSSEDGRHLYELHTTNGAPLVWGSAPGAEQPHENSAAQKIGMLLALQESQIAAGAIDLRTPAELTSTAAPASR